MDINQTEKCCILRTDSVEQSATSALHDSRLSLNKFGRWLNGQWRTQPGAAVAFLRIRIRPQMSHNLLTY